MAAKPRIINTANKNRKNQKKSNNSNKNKKEPMEFQSEEDLYRRIKFGIKFASEEDEKETEEEPEEKQIEIEDYLKENKKKTKKKNKFKRLLITIIIVVFLILISRLSIFSINNIEVEGNSYLPKEKVIEISGVQNGVNIFDVGKLRTIDTLEANPYIESANIDKKLPSTLVLKIVERSPEFIISNDERFAYISQQGYVLEIVEENALTIPKIIGFKAVLETLNVGKLKTEVNIPLQTQDKKHQSENSLKMSKGKEMKGNEEKKSIRKQLEEIEKERLKDGGGIVKTRILERKKEDRNL